MVSADPHILVAYKRTRYEHYVVEGDDPSIQALIDEDDESVRDLVDAHETHKANLQRVLDHLRDEGFDFTPMYRGDLNSTDEYDLVITCGGDGTVLDVSHHVDSVPMLAVNSHPNSSVGYFCAGDADAFPELLEQTLEAQWRPYELSRFQVSINGTPIEFPVLNDVLFGHSNPAAVSRYTIEVDGGEPEEQRSSGIWISTPAGSTAAIRSAGGFVLPLDSNYLEFLVREPYPMLDRPYRYEKGIHPIGEPFKVVSRMKNGRVFIDGPHITRDVTVGDVIEVGGGAPPLRLYGLDERRRHG